MNQIGVEQKTSCPTCQSTTKIEDVKTGRLYALSVDWSLLTVVIVFDRIGVPILLLSRIRGAEVDMLYPTRYLIKACQLPSVMGMTPRARSLTKKPRI